MTKRPLQNNPDSSRIKASPESGKKPAGKVPRKISAAYLHNAGLYYLQRFAASTGQFRRVMQQKITKSCHAHPDLDKEECQKLLETLIENFQRSGLLNDELYATGTIRSLRQRGLSARAIMAKMTSKGIPPATTQEILGQIDEIAGNADLAAAVRYARRRRLGPYAKNGSEKERKKQLASMARSGFDFDIACKALDMDKATADNLIESCGL